VNKTQTLQQVHDEFNKLISTVEGMDEGAMSTRFYGEWSAKDILAHIAGWQREMTAALERMARGERPTAEGVDYSNADAWNARFAAAMRGQDATTVVAGLRQSFANYVRAAEAIPDDRYGDGKTVNKLLETSGFGHYREHGVELAEFKAGRPA
jgi:hypothetical protein